MKTFKKTMLLLLSTLVVSISGCNKKQEEVKTTLAINPTTIEMYEDDYALITAETNSTKSVSYVSENSDVVTVNSSGVVFAKNAGKTYVNASVEDLTASCYVTVKPLSEKSEDYIKFEKSLFVIGLNDTSVENTIIPTYYHNGEAINGKSFIYTSLNQSIAEVSSDGKITVKGSGTALIKVSCDSVSANVVLDVYDVVINTTSDWEIMLNTTNKKNSRFCLNNDLDFTDVEYNHTYDFDYKLMGIFEGNYHTVSNITITPSANMQSIFGYAAAFSLTNIRFININFTSFTQNCGLFTSLLQHYSDEGKTITSSSVIKNVLCDFIFSDVISCVIADRFYGANVDCLYAKVRNNEGKTLKADKTFLIAYKYSTWFGTSHFINVIGLVENGNITKDVIKADLSDDDHNIDYITEVKTYVIKTVIEANYLASLSFDSNIWNIKPNELPSFY